MKLKLNSKITLVFGEPVGLTDDERCSRAWHFGAVYSDGRSDTIIQGYSSQFHDGESVADIAKTVEEHAQKARATADATVVTEPVVKTDTQPEARTFGFQIPE